jgi:hypothetical protein
MYVSKTIKDAQNGLKNCWIKIFEIGREDFLSASRNYVWNLQILSGYSIDFFGSFQDWFGIGFLFMIKNSDSIKFFFVFSVWIVNQISFWIKKELL